MTNTVPDPQAVLEQLEEIKRKYLEAQSDVASVRATGFDSDHQVSVTVLGLGEVAGITIDPAAVNPADVDGLQKRILQAFRSANDQARDLASQILAPLNIGLPQPEHEPDPEPGAPAPAVSAPSLSDSATPPSPATPSLSPSLSASETEHPLSATETGHPLSLSTSPEPSISAPAPTAPALDLTLHDLDLTLDEPPAPEPEPELAASAKPSLVNYQHYRPRW